MSTLKIPSFKPSTGYGGHFCFPAVLSLIILLVTISAYPSEPQYSPEDILSFAMTLYNRGDYQLSLLEYKRFLSRFPDHERKMEALEGEANCQFGLGNYDAALQLYIDLARSFSLTEKGWEVTLKIARCYQALGQTATAEEVLSKIASQSTYPQLAERARFDLGWIDLRRSRWNQAANDFKALSSSSIYGDAAHNLADRAPEGASLKRKDPAVAGVLSGFLPGAGQLYCGQPKDAALAFLLNGIFIGASVESFEHELYVVGGLLLLIETAWYGGNIYNAVNHAHKFNRRQENSFLRSLWEETRMKVVLPQKENDWYQFVIQFRF